MTALFKIIHAIIIGAPGSGKGTVSDFIIKEFSYKYLSCGDILRQNIQSSTPLGIEAEKFIKSGNLVSDELVNKCILDIIGSMESQSWLLDGYPRTVNQAKQLDKTETIDCVLNLIVPHDIIIERIKSRWIHLPSGRVYNTTFNKPKIPFKDDVTGESLVQREDDRPDIVKNRLDVYANLTQPVLNYYKSRKLLAEFKGETSYEIWPHVQQFLRNFK